MMPKLEGNAGMGKKRDPFQQHDGVFVQLTHFGDRCEDKLGDE